MDRSRAAPGGLFLMALWSTLAAACVDVRERPPDPTAPEDASARASFVRITHPAEGQEILKRTFIEEPGVQVSFEGRFEVGHRLLLLTFTDEFPTSPVFAAEAKVEGGGAPSTARILVAPRAIQGASEVEILLRLLEGADDFIISTDSVGIILR